MLSDMMDSTTKAQPGAMIPTTLRYLVSEAEGRGVCLEDAFRRGGSTLKAMDLPHLTVSYQQYRKVLVHTLAVLDDPTLGLIIGARLPVTSHGLLGLGVMSSRHLVEALEFVARYQSLWPPVVRWAMDATDTQILIVGDPVTGSPELDAFFIDKGFASITRSARDVVSADFAPVMVELARPRPVDDESYEAFFNSPVVFGCERNLLHIDGGDGLLAIGTADQWTRAAARATLDSRLTQTAPLEDVVATLSAQVIETLPATWPLGHHARELAMSERTLRRRLRDVNTTYSAVVDEARRRIVTQLLAQQGLSLAAIAARSGYENERSLRRAVHRWYGCSPSKIRQQPSPC